MTDDGTVKGHGLLWGSDWSEADFQKRVNLNGQISEH